MVSRRHTRRLAASRPPPLASSRRRSPRAPPSAPSLDPFTFLPLSNTARTSSRSAHARLEPAPQSEYEPARAPSSSTPRAYRREVWRASTRGVSRRRSRRRPRARSVCGPARPSTRHPGTPIGTPIGNPTRNVTFVLDRSLPRALAPRSARASRRGGRGVSSRVGTRLERGRGSILEDAFEFVPSASKRRGARARGFCGGGTRGSTRLRRLASFVVASMAFSRGLRAATWVRSGERSSCSPRTRRRGALARVGRRSRRGRFARERARRSLRARARGAPPGFGASVVGAMRRARFGTEVGSSRGCWTLRREPSSPSRACAFRARGIEARADRCRRRWASRAGRWPVARFPWRVPSRALVSRATVGVSRNGRRRRAPKKIPPSAAKRARRRVIISFARLVTPAWRVPSASVS